MHFVQKNEFFSWPQAQAQLIDLMSHFAATAATTADTGLIWQSSWADTVKLEELLIGDQCRTLAAAFTNYNITLLY